MQSNGCRQTQSNQRIAIDNGCKNSDDLVKAEFLFFHRRETIITGEIIK